MASRVSTDLSAQSAASEYLAKRHPELAGRGLSVLKLGLGWLVEATPDDATSGDRPSRVVLMINRHGFVEEIWSGRSPRQVSPRRLAPLQAIDLT
jgi:hypothetical protein